MPINTVSEKQVMVHAYTTNGSHKRFPYSYKTETIRHGFHVVVFP